MKTALVILENHFLIDTRMNVWCNRVVDYNYLKRYLSVFEKIIVSGRCQKVDNINSDSLLVSGDNIIFLPLPDFVGAKGLLKNLKVIRNIISSALDNSDCVIYRAPTHLSLFTYKEAIKKNKVLGLEFMMAADKMIDGDGILVHFLNKIIDSRAKKMVLSANGVSYVTENILQKKYPCKALTEVDNLHYFTSSYSSLELNEEDYFMQNWTENNKPKVFKIIHIGYMDSYRKGQHVLLKSIKMIKDSGYNIRVTMIGDGVKKSEFEALSNSLGIDDVVRFVGAITDKKTILTNLRNSHLFVFPTQSEGLPRTLIEAMSQGLPCISSPVDGIPELLDEEYLIPYNNVKELANKIIELINDWNSMIKISKKNYEKSKQYSKKILDKRRHDFYEKMYILSDKQKN